MIFEFVNKEEVKKLMSDEITNTAESTLVNSHDGGLLVEEIAGVCEQNNYSGKNLIPYPYYNTTLTINGVTFTELADRSVSASGTSTSSASFIFSHRIDNSMVLGAGTYRLSGCPSGASTSTYRLVVAKTSASGSFEMIAIDYGNGIEFTLTEDTDLYVGFEVIKGATVNNTICRPMVTKADITDNTYEPYVGGIPSPSPSYPQEIKNSVVNEIKTQSKNLIPYPYDYTTMTANGITWTDLGDGRVMANGTATADSPFNCQNRTDTETPFILPVGTYILSGCPSGGSGSTYRNLAGRTNPETGAHEAFATDTGNGATFTITEESTTTQIQLMIKKGTTVNNLIFEPMLRRADITDDTFEPYKATTVTLSQPIELNRVEVSADDAYTHEKDGKYYISDTIEKIDGEYKKVQRIGKSNGQELSWSLSTTYIGSVNTRDLVGVINHNVPVLCSHTEWIKYSLSNYIYGKTIVSGAGQVNFYLKNEAFVDENEVKTWILENDFYFQYALLESIITPLPTADQIALNSLKTFDGITYLEFDSEVEPVFSVDYGTSKAGAMALETLLSGEVTELNVGDLTALETEAKDSIVLAINELHRGLSDIDSTLVAMATTETY